MQGNWQRERARVLQRICTLIAGKMQAGGCVTREARRAAGRWEGKRFKCAPDRRLRVGVVTIRRVYYAWRRQGEAALMPGYRSMAGSRVPKHLLAEFKRALARADVRSFAHALRLVKRRWDGRRRSFPCMHSFMRALGEEARSSAKKAFQERADAARQERELREALAGGKR